MSGLPTGEGSPSRLPVSAGRICFRAAEEAEAPSSASVGSLPWILRTTCVSWPFVLSRYNHFVKAGQENLEHVAGWTESFTLLPSHKSTSHLLCCSAQARTTAICTPGKGVPQRHEPGELVGDEDIYSQQCPSIVTVFSWPDSWQGPVPVLYQCVDFLLKFSCIFSFSVFHVCCVY